MGYLFQTGGETMTATTQPTPTLTVCIQTKNEEFFLPMSLRSALTVADEVIIVDDMSTDRTKDVVERFQQEYVDKKIVFIQDDFKLHFGKQRQVAAEKATSDWILWLDADECLADNVPALLREKLPVLQKDSVGLVTVQYQHFIENFSKVDASEAIHFGLNRLHQNLSIIRHDFRVNHTYPTPTVPDMPASIDLDIVIFHCGYLAGMQKIYERYKRNVRASEMHHPLQQMAWRDWHMLGTYPTKPFAFEHIPSIIKEHYDLGCFDLDRCRDTKNVFWKRGVQ